MFGSNPASQGADALPGRIISNSQTQQQITKVIKSLRLIWMIRIIKLYKYVTKGKKKPKDESKKKQKKRDNDDA